MRHGIPSLGALQAFEATARLGAFSRAAEELALTHSAIHRQVSSLEEGLGVQLFTRVRRRITLTDAGQEYAARVRHHLEQLEKDTLSLMSRSAMGRSLHIAVLPTLATVWLMPRLIEFNRVRPDITVNLSVRTTPFQFSDHPFDAAIYHGTQLWSGTQGFKLFDETELLAVCTPELLAANNNNIRKMTHLHMMSRPDAWRMWYYEQNDGYSPKVAAGPRYELFSLTLVAVHAGLGVALVPRFLVADDLHNGSLVQAHEGVLKGKEAYFFSYPRENQSSEALIAFEQWLMTSSDEQ
ncbi:LysR substrate-binding domain-containing protein [Paenalcaligenes niemegkensis]|uniref:LysR substrate-binding domain-containing protein n=1 Tax=Paenalcaligenes niemegkensis TaxID=2895469 RepID=UPI001EE7B457|nr:LysR substrate-binding domain-containing protein [Paenalcaligenes niemegkensis]MCQ9617135.1 LysR substrate-binding domain-containing protein [Paenalcaligenes niemegkensis]